MAYAYEAKATTDDQDPIEVEALPDGSFRLTDGRHRALACLIAGRPDVLAVLQGS
jgi:ParB-like chromosome segregation protein Spo0J